jgi:hypothetical protein
MAPRHFPQFKSRCMSINMITLEAHCRSGHYFSAIVPVIDKHLSPEYRVLVFWRGHEVYNETERSLQDAMETAKAYLDWRTDQDLDN